MGSLLSDLRYAARRLASNRARTASILAILALASGANTALFAIVHGLLLAPLPGVRADGLYSIHRIFPEQSTELSRPSWLDFTMLASRADLFQGVLASSPFRESAAAGGSAQVIAGEYVSRDYFDVLGVALARGSTQTTQHERVAVIAWDMWQSLFHGAEQALGKPIYINGIAFDVVGITPPGFRGIHTPTLVPTAIWLPIEAAAGVSSSASALNLTPDAARIGVYVKARVRDGISPQQLQSGLDSIGKVVAELHAPFNGQRLVATAVKDETATSMLSQASVPVSVAVLLLGVLVLTAAAAGIANLFLADVLARSMEFGTRLGNGATTPALLRLVGIEAAMLVVLGGALGVAVALATVALGLAAVPPIEGMRPNLHVTLNWSVLGYTLAALAIALLTVAIGPGWYLTRHLNQVGLEQIARRFSGSSSPWQRRLTTCLVTGQVAIACVLLVTTALMLRESWTLTHRNAGFVDHDVTTVHIDLRYQRQRAYQASDALVFFDALRGRLHDLPQVQGVALVDRLPVGTTRNADQIIADAASRAKPRTVSFARISPEYFEVIGTRLLRGRSFAPTDVRDSEPVAIVSEATARYLWPNEEALGKVVIMVEDGGRRRVVGVAADSDVRGVGERGRLFMYVPFSQLPSTEARVLLKVSGEPGAVMQSAANTILTMDPRLPILETITLREYLDRMTYPSRTRAVIVSAFSALCVLLSVFGVAGMTEAMLRQRRKELAIRITLGMSPRRLTWDILRQSLVVLTSGFAIGVPAAIVGVRLLSRFVTGAPAASVATIAVTCVLLAVCIVCGPALHAANMRRLAPASVLRES